MSYYKLTIGLLFLLVNPLFSQENKTIDEVKGLQIGELVADFSAEAANGKTFLLSEQLKKGSIVLVFIRGQWCPYCNKHLSDLQDNLPAIYEKGASVVIVSPEKPEYIEKSIEKTGAEFTFLYDEGYNISKAFDVLFLPEKGTQIKYNLIGANFKESHSDGTAFLPVPATFIIDGESKIIWRQFDEDYKNRSAVTDILSNIP